MANGFNTFFTGVGPKLASEVDDTDLDFKNFLPEENPTLFVLFRNIRS